MKYSIIIPTLNSLTYLKDAIDSIISQEFDDYELIVSDDCSRDKTYAYVESLSHKNIVLIQPDKRLPMAEHWEFAISHAKGDWITVVGSDDGLMPHFFGLAEHLTALAVENNIEVIGSERAFYFWKGCQSSYGDLSVVYSPVQEYSMRDSTFGFINSCVGPGKSYNILPHVYTSSLVHRNVLEKIKRAQSGKLFTSLVTDASLAGNIALVTDKYIHSMVPMGWVGSSTASAGIRGTKKISHATKNDLYATSYLKWHATMGTVDEAVQNHRFIFYETILNSTVLPKDSFYSGVIHSKFFRTLVFASVCMEINEDKDKDIYLPRFYDVLAINNISMEEIKNCLLSIVPKVYEYCYSLAEIEEQKRQTLFGDAKGESPQRIWMKHSETDCHCLMDAWKKINELNKQDAMMSKYYQEMK